MALGVVDGEGVRGARAETEPVYGLLYVMFTNGPPCQFPDVNEPTVTDHGFLVAIGADDTRIILRNDAINYFTWRADLPIEMPNAV